MMSNYFYTENLYIDTFFLGVYIYILYIYL